MYSLSAAYLQRNKGCVKFLYLQCIHGLLTASLQLLDMLFTIYLQLMESDRKSLQCR